MILYKAVYIRKDVSGKEIKKHVTVLLPIPVKVSTAEEHLFYIVQKKDPLFKKTDCVRLYRFI